VSDYYGNADALAQLESELGQVFYISGSPVPYPCIVGDRKDMKDLGYGGYANGAAVEIVVRQSLFTAAPTLKTDSGIRSFLIDDTGSHWEINLDMEQGRNIRL